MMKETFIQGPGGKIWTAVFGEEEPGIPLLVINSPRFDRYIVGKDIFE